MFSWFQFGYLTFLCFMFYSIFFERFKIFLCWHVFIYYVLCILKYSKKIYICNFFSAFRLRFIAFKRDKWLSYLMPLNSEKPAEFKLICPCFLQYYFTTCTLNRKIQMINHGCSECCLMQISTVLGCKPNSYHFT